MQCGLGWGEDRFAAMGANFKTRPSAFEESLDIVRRLLAGEIVNSSRRFRVAEARLALRPAEPVEVWIGASAPPAIDRAARLAEGWIASPGLTREEARSQADMYREGCTAYGRQPGAVVLRRDIYVGESSSEARAVLEHALGQGYRGVPREALIAGSVNEVAEQFRDFEELGYTDILVRHRTSLCVDAPAKEVGLRRPPQAGLPRGGRGARRRAPCASRALAPEPTHTLRRASPSWVSQPASAPALRA